MGIVSAFSLVAVLAAPPAAAPPSGEDLFKTYCASCHGQTGKGDGVMAPHLRFRPADLTLIARRRAGRFDTDEVRKIVDGREPVASHGGTEMPVWGDAFKIPSERYSEKTAQTRIRALVDYLKSIQAK
ncbi:MAG TPA: cytochrome c [Vicinamibacteria bacterium]|jgi:mono/diheme cytochrome c family protein